MLRVPSLPTTWFFSGSSFRYDSHLSVWNRLTRLAASFWSNLVQLWSVRLPLTNTVTCLRFRSKAYHVQRCCFFFSTNDQNSSSSRSAMRLGTTGSGIFPAAVRISLSTVFVLMRRTRLMSRIPEPFMVIGRISNRTSAL